LIGHVRENVRARVAYSEPGELFHAMRSATVGVRMLRRDYAGQDCPIAQTLEIIGDRWTMLIVRDAFLGLRRFDEFHASLGVSRNILADRLNRLVEEGLFERVLYNEHPPRYEYTLTKKGRDLNVALTALRQWGEEYVCEPIRILRRKGDRKRAVAAIVEKGTPAIPVHELELVPVGGRRLARRS
jgi:DNA-binding HxlR family transcriptional regulator